MSRHFDIAGPMFRRRSETLRRRQSAFTLIELLVVIAIIAILAAILLPSLARAKDASKKVNCMSNLRQLQVCWHLYSNDFGDILAPNDDISTLGASNGPENFNQTSWCEGHPQIDTTPIYIQQGLLFPYNSSVAIYHCPADVSTVLDANGSPEPRTRSYNMSQSVNGLGMLPDPNDFNLPVDTLQPCFEKFCQITNPSPSGLFVFLDENEITIYDAQFGYPMPNYDYGVWWDMPSNRHIQGANFSFADGHVEYWRWMVPMIATSDIGQPVATGQWSDYNRVGNAMRIVPYTGLPQ